MQNGAPTTAPSAALPPQNLEAEESVLGALLVTESALVPVLLDVSLRAEEFYRERHRLVFRAIFDLYNRSEPVDPLTVTALLEQSGDLEEAGGRDFVVNLAATVPAAGNAAHYGRIVKQAALLRRLLDASHTIQASVNERAGAPRDLVEQAERLLFKVAHEENQGDFRRIDDLLTDEIDKLEELARGDVELTGTPAGFRDLDAVTGGFQPGNLVIVAARPSMGKSAFVANIAEHVALKEKRAVAFFSLEMAEAELAQRFIASRAKISGDRLRKGQVSGESWNKVVTAANEYMEAPLWIDDSSDISLLELRAKARRLHAQESTEASKGLGLIIVDYLQLMRPDQGSQSRVEQVSAMSRGLKILARELNVPVIALSQLSRAPEQRPDKKPLLSDLRESGQIEQDADLVCFLFREDYYDKESERQGVADVLIAKHRNGPTTDVELAFLGQYPKFVDLAKSSAGSAPSPNGEQPF